MTSNAEPQGAGVYALVSYVPDPLGFFLSELRQSLPGDENPQPHITILPPRPLLLPVGEVSLAAKKKLAGRSQFEVELGAVNLFPETNVLYLGMAEGVDELLELHAMLNTDSLYHAERFEYSPHLTLSMPFSEDEVENGRKNAEDFWSQCSLSRRFAISEIVFLWQEDGADWRRWQRLWSHRLADPAARAAGAPKRIS